MATSTRQNIDATPMLVLDLEEFRHELKRK